MSSDLPKSTKSDFSCHNKMGWDWKSIEVGYLAILPAGR